MIWGGGEVQVLFETFLLIALHPPNLGDLGGHQKLNAGGGEVKEKLPAHPLII